MDKWREKEKPLSPSYLTTLLEKGDVMRDLFHGIKDKIDFRIDARVNYETRVVSKPKLLDIGGRNNESRSRKHIKTLNNNLNNVVVSTDIIADYQPDLVDDICNTKIEASTFDGVYCDAILEHVTEYWKAIDNIHKILKPEGEAFFYTPFFYPFHDLMDYHRFTFTEMYRMLDLFSEVRIFLPDAASGYGYVFWYVATFGAISKFPKIHRILTGSFNALFKIGLFIAYKLKLGRLKTREYTFQEIAFYYIYLAVNHGFCAWVKK